MTSTTCKALLDAGYQVTVERSTQRIFDGGIPTTILSLVITDLCVVIDKEFAEVC